MTESFLFLAAGLLLGGGTSYLILRIRSNSYTGLYKDKLNILNERIHEYKESNEQKQQ